MYVVVVYSYATKTSEELADPSDRGNRHSLYQKGDGEMMSTKDIVMPRGLYFYG